MSHSAGNFTMMSVNPCEAVGNLSHLVEAAAALAALHCQRATEVHPLVSPLPQMSVLVSEDDEKNSSYVANISTSNKRDTFPQRLMELLNDSSLSDVITWLPHGRSFVILRPDVFAASLLIRFLPVGDKKASPKYPSFTRKLNRWGFRQATRGPDTGAFHHPLFRKDKPELCLQMACQRSKISSGDVGDNNPSSDSDIRDELPNEKCPPKKKFLRLTKASLDVVSPPDTTTRPKSFATVSVSDDAQSVTSQAPSSEVAPSLTMPPPAPVRPLPHGSITTDLLLIQEALRRRNEVERMNVAKVMLYEAYLKALRGQ